MTKEQTIQKKWKPEFTTLLVVMILFIFAAAFNGVMDVLQFRYSRSVFASEEHAQYFNPDLSWRNKWKEGDHKKGEAYPGSSTVFVLFTDAWHLAQCLMFTCFELAVLFLLYKLYKFKWYWLLAIFLGMKVVFGLTFGIFFDHLLLK